MSQTQEALLQLRYVFIPDYRHSGKIFISIFIKKEIDSNQKKINLVLQLSQVSVITDTQHTCVYIYVIYSHTCIYTLYTHIRLYARSMLTYVYVRYILTYMYIYVIYSPTYILTHTDAYMHHICIHTVAHRCAHRSPCTASLRCIHMYIYVYLRIFT